MFPPRPKVERNRLCLSVRRFVGALFFLEPSENLWWDPPLFFKQLVGSVQLPVAAPPPHGTGGSSDQLGHMDHGVVGLERFWSAGARPLQDSPDPPQRDGGLSREMVEEWGNLAPSFRAVGMKFC